MITVENPVWSNEARLQGMVVECLGLVDFEEALDVVYILRKSWDHLIQSCHRHAGQGK